MKQSQPTAPSPQPFAEPAGRRSVHTDDVALFDLVERAECFIREHPHTPALDTPIFELATRMAEIPIAAVIAEALCLSLHYHGHPERPEKDAGYQLFRRIRPMTVQSDDAPIANAWAIGKRAQILLFDRLNETQQNDYICFFSQHAPIDRAEVVNQRAGFPLSKFQLQ